MTTTLSIDLTDSGETKSREVRERDLFASLVSLYRDAGLSPRDARRAAEADYACGFDPKLALLS